VLSCTHCGHDLPSFSTKRTDRHCPDCDLPLLKYALGDLPVEQCRGCKGVFVERQDLEGLYADRWESQVGYTTDSRTPPKVSVREDVRYRRCPRCSRLMRHRLLGTRRGGVIVDICAQHGTWFDRGELQKAAWLACSGSLARDERLKAAELQSRMEELRREREPARPEPTPAVSVVGAAVWWGEDLLLWLFD